ncbi:nucleotide disphospho-sugar-binding domain-containing protein [Streptomyces sp. NPDC048172]|uniref:nucleotide disphospho-sugar-binding domain-containing protein n=1 Tax=Streptomyces sp. NPDC048172 TaxID=3365505 RepID=UPI0037186EFC
MRYLFTTTPGFSHVTPLVPLAHAAQLAGHQVLFAVSGPALRAVTEAGLPAVEAAPGQDVTRPYITLATTAVEREMSVEETMDRVFAAFGEIGDMLLDGVEDTARTWGADAVLHPPMLPAGLVAARNTGVPAVVHGLGLRHPSFPLRGRAAAVHEGSAHPDAEISLGPDSLERVSPTAPRGESPYPVLTMRPSSYNGGGELPSWALRRGERRRIVVTLGSVAAHSGQAELLSALVRGTAELGVEVVLTSGGADLSALIGEPPPHVRAVDWIPLSALLPTCDGVVHHGGMGTMFAALGAGVPQVIVPTTKGDALSNARVLTERGAGLELAPADVAVDSVAKTVGALLDTPAPRAASQEVAAEMAAMPSPAATVASLAALLS